MSVKWLGLAFDLSEMVCLGLFVLMIAMAARAAGA